MKFMEIIMVFVSAISALAVSAISGRFLVPFLRKVKCGQTIKDIGPAWHKGKQGTPTMGGIMIVIGMLVSLVITACVYFAAGEGSLLFPNAEYCARIGGGIVMALLFGAIGFIDDYIKVVKKQNLGLKARQKLVLQFAVAALYLFSLKMAGATSETYIPFVGPVNLGIFYWIIAAVAIVGIVNAVNLTDGIDGLNGSVTFFAGLIMFLICSQLRLMGLEYFATALSGACLGYLVWNFYPAKVFMGDTGSLFLGGAVCALLFGCNLPILVLLVGIIYLAEMLSVVLQVVYFKLTHGKRLFLMSPIHHHFEKKGWKETKIVTVFSAVQFIFGIAAYIIVIFGVK